MSLKVVGIVLFSFILSTLAVPVEEVASEEPPYGSVEQKAYLNVHEGPLDQFCLDVICEARGGCSGEHLCASTQCGPYGITFPFWRDSGKPKLKGDSLDGVTAFMRCAAEVDCSQRSVQGYMNRFKRDCNGDGVVDCKDFWKIHMLGGYECTDPLGSYWQEKFDDAWTKLKAKAGNEIHKEIDKAED